MTFDDELNRELESCRLESKAETCDGQLKDRDSDNHYLASGLATFEVGELSGVFLPTSPLRKGTRLENARNLLLSDGRKFEVRNVRHLPVGPEDRYGFDFVQPD